MTAQTTAKLTDETRHRLLGSKRRRDALEILSDEEPPVALNTLARKVGAENGESFQRVKIALHHHDLPMMDSCGVIEYEQGICRIQAVSHFD